MELAKFRITFSVTITTAIGYFLAPRADGLNFIWPVLGILFIGMSSAALNHLQDRNLDALMVRTKNRPLPSGRVTSNQVIFFVFLFLIPGAVILHLKTNAITTVLGLSAFFWYNSIYTYLKRISSIAVIPGALIGGIPPLLGWTAAGGEVLNPYIISVSMMLVIWQVPHFWLLLFMYRDDYERAGLPVLMDQIGERASQIVTYIGIVATILSAFIILLAGNILNYWTIIAMGLISFKLMWDSEKLIFPRGMLSYKKIFMSTNLFTLGSLGIVVTAHFLVQGIS